MYYSKGKMLKKNDTKKIKKNKKAFSLMELMVVIIILGLLAAFVLPNLIGKAEEAKEKIVCIQMKAVSQSLKMYKIDTSIYPSTSEGLELLVTKKYFEDGKLPVDAWNNAFIYTLTNGEFELISLGIDKTESTQDDIVYTKCK